ncbi:hypothetical protein FEM48_Zijuj06G0083800 [Ziziphus jujuba var. spinosa]|uniref:pectinesterase n=1 Tax=Ziziphus jujuba var. spinosa TaxID=714518 RepID=A0A978V871_ZIZJJ|nr:hypothetical protein FEM48_Zijuj06G0083800 [Ziziphus jujuba var. spinosa]
MAFRGSLFKFLVVITLSDAFLTVNSQAETTDPTKMTAAILIRVDQSGKGDYTKIQDAIDAVPSNNTELVFVLIKPGIYKEKVTVPADKPFITVSGTKAAETIVTWNDSENIFECATFTVLASDFVARYLTIQKCHLHSVSEGAGAITAQRRESPAEDTGFTFLGCTITGVKTAVLGRPWGSYSRVVFAFSYMSSAILPQGWNDWGDSSKQSTVYYGQYKCYGRGAITSKRVGWARSLTSQEASPFLTKDFIGAKDWIRPAPTSFRTASKPISHHSDGNN